MTIAVGNDKALHKDILDELALDPKIEDGAIGTAVEGGVVTMTGTVRSFSEKWAAEEAVKRVRGVRGIANDLIVDLPGTHRVNDTDLAQTAATLLIWDVSLPPTLRVSVEHGVLTLSGEVDWQFQRTRAEKAIRHLTGVTGVINDITLRSLPAPSDIRNLIREALRRDVEVDEQKIEIAVADRAVTLTGSAHSWTERKAAERAAWSVPGISAVHNRIVVEG
ncbi:MAG: BON domain-containing protein [Vulcanimicrobiaceae bacterium]